MIIFECGGKNIVFMRLASRLERILHLLFNDFSYIKITENQRKDSNKEL